jgi:hypothetical protein
MHISPHLRSLFDTSNAADVERPVISTLIVRFRDAKTDGSIKLRVGVVDGR